MESGIIYKQNVVEDKKKSNLKNQETRKISYRNVFEKNLNKNQLSNTLW